MKIILLIWVALLINNPYLIALLFGQVLVLVTIVLGRVCKLVGFIIFLVYIGGLMVLLRYCVMLLPTNKFITRERGLILIGLIVIFWFCGLPLLNINGFSFGLLYSASVILLLSILLFIVMLSVVTIIDYSRGILKIYDKPVIVFHDSMSFDIYFTKVTNLKLFKKHR